MTDAQLIRFVSSRTPLLTLRRSCGPHAAQTSRRRPRRGSTSWRAKPRGRSRPRSRRPDQTRPTTPRAAGRRRRADARRGAARALERNLDIAVERLNPQTFDLNIARIRAAYRPLATSTFGQQSRVQPPTSTLNGGTIVDNDTTTYNSGLTQQVPWGGGRFAFQFNNNKQVTSNNLVNYNPAFNSNFALTYTQPLLRGFHIDSNRQQLRVTAINRDISEIQLRGTIATTLANVRNAYWELRLRAAGGRRRAGLARPRRASWCRTTRRASRSARWHRSTSCRRRRKRRRGARRWRRPTRSGGRRSWR